MEQEYTCMWCEDRTIVEEHLVKEGLCCECGGKLYIKKRDNYKKRLNFSFCYTCDHNEYKNPSICKSCVHSFRGYPIWKKTSDNSVNILYRLG